MLVWALHICISRSDGNSFQEFNARREHDQLQSLVPGHDVNFHHQLHYQPNRLHVPPIPDIEYCAERYIQLERFRKDGGHFERDLYGQHHPALNDEHLPDLHHSLPVPEYRPVQPRVQESES